MINMVEILISVVISWFIHSLIIKKIRKELLEDLVLKKNVYATRVEESLKKRVDERVSEYFVDIPKKSIQGIQDMHRPKIGKQRRVYDALHEIYDNQAELYSYINWVKDGRTNRED